MSWRGVGWIYLALALLTLVVVVDRQEHEPAPAFVGTAAEQSLLGTEAAAISAIAFRREGASVRASRDGERWRVLEPAGTQMPSDLIAAAVATLTTGQVSEVLVETAGPQLGAFGLTEPETMIEVSIGGDPPRTIRVLAGANNPTGTALYAMRDDGPAVFLVGLNLRYYTELIFQAAAVTQR